MDYDFSMITEKLAQIHAHDESAKKTRFKQSVFVFPEFYDFAAYFFTHEFLPLQATKLINEHHVPFDEDHKLSEEGLRCAWDSSTAETKRAQSAVRNIEVYPLRVQELEKARRFIRSNPYYHTALAAIQACCIAYVEGIISHIGKGEISDTLGKVQEAAETFSFLGDLSPVLAWMMVEDNKQTFEGATLRDPKLLRTLFNGRQIFRSEAEDKITGAKNIITKCPFSSAFLRVMATHLTVNGDTITAEPGEFGDFIETVKNYITEISAPEDRCEYRYAVQNALSTDL